MRNHLLCLLVLSAAACQAKPPTLSAAEVKVIGVSEHGLQLLIELDAYNPNRTPVRLEGLMLDAQRAGGASLGRGLLDEPQELAPHRRERYHVPVELAWADQTVFLDMITQSQDVDINVVGHAGWQSGSGDVDFLPFLGRSTISKAALTGAANPLLGSILAH